MNIERVHIKGFGKLNDLDLSLDSGVNIIYGENESGKSSLQFFIKSMLYGLKGGRALKDGSPSMLKRFKPWAGTHYGGFLEYRLDNGDCFRVERDFNTGSIKIYDSFFNDITASFDIKKEKGVMFAEKHLRINEACFDKTVFVRQSDIPINGNNSLELQNKLINISQTGYESISLNRACTALEEAIKTYIGTDKTSTRPLDKVIARLEELAGLRSGILKKRESVQEVYLKLGEARRKSKILNEKKDMLSAIKEQLAKKASLNSMINSREKLQNIIESIKVKKAELNKIIKDADEIEIGKKLYSAFSSFSPENAEDISSQYYKASNHKLEIERLEKEISQKRAELDSIKKELSTLKPFEELEPDVISRLMAAAEESGMPEPKKRSAKPYTGTTGRMPSGRKHAALSFAAAAFIFSGFILSILPRQSAVRFSGAVLLFLGAAAGIYSLVNIITFKKPIKAILDSVGASSLEEFLRMKSHYDSCSRQYSDINAGIARLENDLARVSRQYDEAMDSIIFALSTAGIINEDTAFIDEKHIKAFKEGVAKYRELGLRSDYCSRIRMELKSALDNLYLKASDLCGLECSNEAELEAAAARMSESIQQYTNELASSDVTVHYINAFDVSMDCNNIDAVNKEYDSICNELSALNLKIREYEVLLENSKEDEDNLRKIDEETAYLIEKKEKLEDIGFSLKVALDVLTEAGTEIQHSFAPALNSRMSRYIAGMTGGKYNDLRADDNLNLNITVPETGNVANASILSEGTKDQLYLALRLSMADLITLNSESLPLIMDEVFAKFDEKRLKETMKFFKNEVKNQLILFTCRRREVDIAQEVFGSSVNIIRLEDGRISDFTG